MKTRRLILVFTVLAMMGGLAACNLPISTTPTPFQFPTPNQTMTALFSNPVVIPPTVTVQPTAQASATLAPAATAAPTATLPPTNTPAQPPAPTVQPTATKTSVPTNMRSSASATAVFLSKAPEINGPWDEWTSKAYAADYVVYGSKERSGKDDLSVSYRAGWDNTYLYLALKVYDDKFVNNASGAQIFKGDSVDILIDTNVSGDFFSDSLSSDDFQIGIAAGKDDVGEGMSAYLWYPSGKAGNLTNIKMAAVKSEGIWRLETAIPWSVLGVTPSNGMHLGFALSVSDNDDGSKDVQQSMVSSAPNRILTDPTTWGDLTLQK